MEPIKNKKYIVPRLDQDSRYQEWNENTLNKFSIYLFEFIFDYSHLKCTVSATYTFKEIPTTDILAYNHLGWNDTNLT